MTNADAAFLIAVVLSVGDPDIIDAFIQYLQRA